ncbi:MAG: hypothetical protein ACMUIL_03560 [bacterium]
MTKIENPAYNFVLKSKPLSLSFIIRSLSRTMSLLGHSRDAVIIPLIRHWRVILTAGDIFAAPATSEHFNLMQQVAMGAGAAVAICKDEIDDTIIDKNTVVVFDSDNELSIYDGLRHLLGRMVLSRKMAKTGYD